MTKKDVEDILLTCSIEEETKKCKLVHKEGWLNIEKFFNCKFPKEFKYFIDLMSEYIFPGDILNISSDDNNGNDTIIFTYNFEIEYGKRS